MIQQLLRRVCCIPGASSVVKRCLRRRRAQSVAIVMYHGVTANDLAVFNWNHLPAKVFEQQLALLSEQYTVLPLGEVIARLARRAPLPEFTACLTFDDGYLNFYSTAFPLLKRYQLPATMFLVTGLVGTGQGTWQDRLFCAIADTPCVSVRFFRSLWELQTKHQRANAYRAIVYKLKRMPFSDKERAVQQLMTDLRPSGEAVSPAYSLMNWDQVHELRRTGLVDFGAHTHTHQVLSRCLPEMQFDELRRSRDVLHDRLGECKLFAYPNGARCDFDDFTCSSLVRLGFGCGLTTVRGLARVGDDLYRLPRVGVGADTSLEQFSVQLLGL
jgi:peptidoglycan/xylan/chitin deacetylase (PgdA/CDA1 family)